MQLLSIPILISDRLTAKCDRVRFLPTNPRDHRNIRFFRFPSEALLTKTDIHSPACGDS